MFKSTLNPKKYDIIIVGGGISGVSCAVTASKEGMQVLLIEQSGMLGGMGTAGLVTMMMTSRVNFFGLGKKIIDELIDEGGARFIEKPAIKGFNYYPFDAEKMKQKLDDIILKSGVDVLLYSKLVDLKRNKNGIEEIIISCPEGNVRFTADLFVDATGDAMLSYLADEEIDLGDENGDTQAPTMMAYYQGIDFDEYEKFLNLYDDGVSVPKIKMIHSLVPKAVEEGIISEVDFHHPGVFRIDETSSIGLMNVGHIYGADCVSAEGLTKATIKGRKMAREYLNFYRKYVKGFENASLVSTGARLAIRETRRVVGEYVVTFDDKSNYRKFDDAIMRFDGGAVSDVHASSNDKEAYQAYVKLYANRESVKMDDYATLPYRSLLAKNNDNLMVIGRCISADRRAQGQIRLMGYCFMMGEAAGFALAQARTSGTSLKQVDVCAVQKKLAENGVPTV